MMKRVSLFFLSLCIIKLFQTHKLCANFNLTTGMSVNKMFKNNKATQWRFIISKHSPLSSLIDFHLVLDSLVQMRDDDLEDAVDSALGVDLNFLVNYAPALLHGL